MDAITQRCPSCGKLNRIPPDRLTDRGKCGSCGEMLPPIDSPVDVEPKLLELLIRKARVPVLVEFWAPWCGACRAAAPEVDAVARELADRAIVAKVDTEKFPELASRQGVRGIPTFVVYKDGKAKLQQAGAVSRREMRAWLEGAHAA